MGNLNVIISYPVSSENFKLISEALKDLHQPIYAFTLAPDLETTITNRDTRVLADWEIEQIKKTYKENFHKPDYGVIIDNSNQTAEETAEEIFKQLPLEK